MSLFCKQTANSAHCYCFFLKTQISCRWKQVRIQIVFPWIGRKARPRLRNRSEWKLSATLCCISSNDNTVKVLYKIWSQSRTVLFCSSMSETPKRKTIFISIQLRYLLLVSFGHVDAPSYLDLWLISFLFFVVVFFKWHLSAHFSEHVW